MYGLKVRGLVYWDVRVISNKGAVKTLALNSYFDLTRETVAENVQECGGRYIIFERFMQRYYLLFYSGVTDNLRQTLQAILRQYQTGLTMHRQSVSKDLLFKYNTCSPALKGNNPTVKMKKINLFLIDDHPVTKFGVSTMLKNQDIGISGTAQNVDEFLGKAAETDFQVILLDLYIPGSHPVENIKRIRQAFPSMPIVIFSSEEREHWLRQMMELGINGYVVKNAQKDELVFTIKKAALGEFCIIGKNKLSELNQEDESGKFLTDNQTDILRMIAEGKRQADIARIKQTSVSNIEKTLRSIRRKFNLDTTNKLIRYCEEHGYMASTSPSN